MSLINTLAASCTATDKTLTVSTAGVFPANWDFIALIKTERLLVTNVSGVTLTVVRGENAEAYDAGEVITVDVNEKYIRDFVAYVGTLGVANLDWDTCWSDAVHSHTSDAEGGVLTATLLDDTPGGTDAEVTKAPTSNVMYDHRVAATGIHGVGASTVESIAGSQGKVDTHGALTAAHGAVSAATASKIVVRDASARAAFAAPFAADDAAILSTVTDHTGLTTAHSAVATATASRIVVRDASARAAFAAPAAAGDALIKGTALTITEMAALTTGKIWQGVANRPSEVDLPAAGAKVTSGTYTGDNATDRAITHGLGATPKLVFSYCTDTKKARMLWNGYGVMVSISPVDTTESAVQAAPGATYFYVNALSTNVNGYSYYWTAIG